MEELMNLSIKLHIFFVLGSIGIASYILYIFYAGIEYIPLTRKVEKITVWYYTVLSAVAFAGLIIMATQKLALFHDVIMMIVAFVILIIASIKEYKLFKKTTVKDIETQNNYRSFAKKNICLI